MPTTQGDFRKVEGHGARNTGEHLIVIANPRAGGGRAGAQRDAIESAARRAFENVEVWWTERPGHATELAARASETADIVAALGGDGSCNEVVNGLMGRETALKPNVIFTTIPFGTGGDLVRSLEVPRSLPEAFWTAGTGTTVHVDLGRVRWPDGSQRWFINVAGVGANAEVAARANRSSKRFGGTITFIAAIASTVREFVPQPVTWKWSGPDGEGTREVLTLGAFLANAHYCGAGLHVGKGGSMADGVLDVTLIPPQTLRQALVAIPAARAGEMGRISGAIPFRASRVEVDGALPIELDGEPCKAAPALVELVPHALQVRGAWIRPPIRI